MTTAAPVRRLAAGLVVPLLAAALVSAGGAAAPASAQSAGSPSPSPSASPPPAVKVTQADSGRTVRLVPGQHLDVELTAPQGEQWQGPAGVGPLYLVDYREGADRTTARLQALRAESEGAVLQARTDRACFHNGQPCPQAFQEWSLTVVVDPGPAASGAYDCPARPVASPMPGATYLDETSSGRVQVEVGEPIHVWLRSCTDHYTVPDAGRGPVWRESAAARAVGYSAATFRGLQPGTATLTASTDPVCAHQSPACARPARQWSVEVEVVPRAPDETCTVPTVVELDRRTIVAGETAGLTVRAASGGRVDLYAYTQPSTAYRLVRSAPAGDGGTVRFAVRPPRNTRLYAQREGCAAGAPVVLSVRTALTLDVERVGTRTYRFSGNSLPARPGGLVVSLYRVGSDGREVLTAQARASSTTGEWQLTRTFVGTGRFGFVARTGADVQNAAGRSTMRTTLVF